MQSVDTLKDAKGTLIAAQDHSKQDDYLPMKTPMKFTEAPAQS